MDVVCCIDPQTEVLSKEVRKSAADGGDER